MAKNDKLMRARLEALDDLASRVGVSTGRLVDIGDADDGDDLRRMFGEALKDSPEHVRRAYLDELEGILG